MTAAETIARLLSIERFLDSSIAAFAPKRRHFEITIMASHRDAVRLTREAMERGLDLPAALHESHHAQYYGTEIDRANSQLTFAIAMTLMGLAPNDPNPWKLKK